MTSRQDRQRGKHVEVLQGVTRGVPTGRRLADTPLRPMIADPAWGAAVRAALWDKGQGITDRPRRVPGGPAAGGGGGGCIPCELWCASPPPLPLRAEERSVATVAVHVGPGAAVPLERPSPHAVSYAPPPPPQQALAETQENDGQSLRNTRGTKRMYAHTSPEAQLLQQGMYTVW